MRLGRARTAAAPVEVGASVLFVCMGNICRSPTAETVFREHAHRAGVIDHLRIESAGIGSWHVGEPPDKRAILHGRRRGYDLEALRARQVTREDFGQFDYILGMDLRNLRDLRALQPAEYKGHLGLFLDFAPHLGVREVPDPYYAGPEAFEAVLELVERASEGLLAHIRTRVLRP